MIRKNSGELSSEQYMQKAQELAKSRQNELEVLDRNKGNMSAYLKDGGTEDPEFKQILDKYEKAGEKSDRYNEAVQFINQSLPNYQNVINELDERLASSMGVPLEEAKVQTSLWEQGRGGFPLDAQNARKKVVGQAKEELMVKYPGVPESVFDKYVKTPSSVDPVNYSDLGDRKNPYFDTRMDLVDHLIDKNYPDIDKATKQKLRRELIDYTTNKSLFERSNKKAQETMDKSGLEAPEVLIESFKKESDKLGNMYAAQMAGFERRMSSIQDRSQAQYEKADAEFISQHKDQLTALGTQLQNNIASGIVTEEEATNLYNQEVEKFNQARRQIYNNHVAEASRQQRLLIGESEKLREDHVARMQALMDEKGIQVEGDQLSAGKEYVDKYNALLNQYMGEDQARQLKEYDAEYRKLTPEAQIANAWKLGYMDMAEGLGGGMKWLGWHEAGNFLTDAAENANATTPLPGFKDFKWSEVTDPDWWINKGVRSLPIMMNLALVGGTTTSLTSGGLASTELSPLVQNIISGTVGAVAMRPIESMIEAGSTYENAIKNGKTDQEAGEAASMVFKKNMNLILLDALQLGVTFGRFPGRLVTSKGGKVSSNLYRLGNSMLGKGLINMTTEGAEEVYQEWAQAKAENPLLTLWRFAQTPAAQEAFALGGLMGAGFSMMGGSEQGQITQVNKMIRQYLNESKGNQDGKGLKRRQMQLNNTIELLKERNVISEREAGDALSAINDAFTSFEKSLSGDIPINWNSDAHTEYTILGRQYRKISQEITANKMDPDNEVRKEQIKAIAKRMKELVSDPASPSYAIDGVPFSKEDYQQVKSELRDHINDDQLSVRNDPEEIQSRIAKADPTTDNTDLVNQYIEQLPEVNDLAGAIDHINAQLTGKRKDGDQEHMAGLERVKEVLEAHQSMEQGKAIHQKIEDGTIVDHIRSLPDEQAMNEYEAAITAMESAGMANNDIESFKSQFPMLSKKQEEMAREDEQINEGFSEERSAAKASAAALSIEQDFFEMSADPDMYEAVREVAPEVVDQIDQYDDIDEVPTDLKQQFLQAARPMQAEQQATEQVEEPTTRQQAEPMPEEVQEEEVESPSRREAKRIEARIKQLKNELKDYVDDLRVLRLTPFPEDQLMKDIKAAGVLAELAYLHIKQGIRTATEFSIALNLQMSEAINNAWIEGLKQFRAERERLVNLDSRLSKVDAFIEFFQDKDVAVKRMIESLREQGIQVDEDMELYIKRELQVSKIEDKIRRFLERIIGKDPSKAGSARINENSFFGRMEQAGINPDDLSLYMYARHAREYNARVREMQQKKQDAEVDRLQAKMAQATTQAAKDKLSDQISDILLNINPEFQVYDSGSGMTDVMAEEIMQHYESQPEAMVLADFAQEFTEEVLQKRIDMLESSGMITSEQADHLRNGTSEDSDIVFEHYVPLKVSRAEFIALNDAGNSSRASAPGGVKRIKGSSRYNFLARNNPLMQAMVDYAATVRHIELNETNKSLMRLIEANPENTLWSVVPSRAQVILNEDGEVTQTIDMVPAEVKENSIVAVVDGKVKYLHMKPVYDQDGNVVPHPVMKALKRGGMQQHRAVSWLINASRYLISIKRNLITTYNIAFGIPNLERDLGDAMANVTTDIEKFNLKKVRRKITMNLIPAYKAVAMSPWQQGGNRMASAFFEAKRAGMFMSWARYEGNDAQIDEYMKIIKNYHKVRGRKGLPVHAIKVVGNFIVGVNDVLENGTRLAVYQAMRDSGLSSQQSAHIAKNITVNFEKKGVATGVINAFYIFSNVGIQGLVRGGKLLYSKQGRKVLAVVFATSFLNQMLLDLGDEKDTLDVYGDFDRDNNFFIYNPWEPDEPFRIPKPYSFVRFAANFGEAAYDVVAGKTSAFNAVARVMGNLQSVIDPVGGAQVNQVSAYAPTFAKIWVEWNMNQKWSGTPFYFSGDGKKGSDLKTAKTAKWATGITDFLNDQTDFWNTGEGLISWSPALLEYIVKDAFGGVGKELTNIYEISTDEFTINKLPIARRFYTDLDEKQELYLYRLYEMIRRPNKMGITEDEKVIARKAYQVVVKEGLVDSRTLGRMRSDFNKKYGVSLD